MITSTKALQYSRMDRVEASVAPLAEELLIVLFRGGGVIFSLGGVESGKLPRT